MFALRGEKSSFKIVVRIVRKLLRPAGRIFNPYVRP
jgi:hypothetical protein